MREEFTNEDDWSWQRKMCVHIAPCFQFLLGIETMHYIGEHTMKFTTTETCKMYVKAYFTLSVPGLFSQ